MSFAQNAETEEADDQYSGSRFGFLQYSALQTEERTDLRNWILLDNESTVHAFCNSKLVSNIHPVVDEPSMTLVSNGGTLTTNLKCDIQNLYQPVWYHKDFITNILSLHLLKQKYHISYDSKEDGGVFIGHRPGKSDLQFKPHSSGLHYYQHRSSNKQMALVETVQKT